MQVISRNVGRLLVREKSMGGRRDAAPWSCNNTPPPPYHRDLQAAAAFRLPLFSEAGLPGLKFGDF